MAAAVQYARCCCGSLAMLCFLVGCYLRLPDHRDVSIKSRSAVWTRARGIRFLRRPLLLYIIALVDAVLGRQHSWHSSKPFFSCVVDDEALQPLSTVHIIGYTCTSDVTSVSNVTWYGSSLFKPRYIKRRAHGDFALRRWIVQFCARNSQALSLFLVLTYNIYI